MKIAAFRVVGGGKSWCTYFCADFVRRIVFDAMSVFKGDCIKTLASSMTPSKS